MALLEIFDRWQAELLMPLVYERAVRGFVCFGSKWSGGEYGAEDFRLLRTLTDQLALSLENGRLYQESVDARERVEATNRKLIEMDRVKKDFVANICHELRTPVSTIIGFSEVLRDTDVNGGGREILDRLVNNGQELAHLMDNLMNYSRMETDSSSAQVEIVKLKEILDGLETMTQRLIRQRPIQFGIQMEPVIETIESDGQKLQQILLELVTNALKFTEKGKIELRIRRLEDCTGDILEIAIADTGIGIRREDQDLIFEDFRQLDGSSTRQYGGTGVGLGLCKKLAKAMGGELHLSSEVGVGSVFSLRLPLKPMAMPGGRSDSASGSTPTAALIDRPWHSENKPLHERIEIVMPQLRQLVIAAENPERLAKFYQEVFDLEKIDENQGALFLSDGIFNLGVVPEPDPKKRGFRHLGFDTARVESMGKKLAQVGIADSDVCEVNSLAGIDHELKDPDGNTVGVSRRAFDVAYAARPVPIRHIALVHARLRRRWWIFTAKFST